MENHLYNITFANDKQEVEETKGENQQRCLTPATMGKKMPNENQSPEMGTGQQSIACQ